MTNFQQQQPRRVDWRHAAVVLFIGCAFCVFAFSEAGGLLANTTLLAASATAIALPLATGLAWLTARKTFPGRPFCDGCFLLLLFLPLFTQLAAWEAGFGRGGWYSTVINQRLSNPPLEGFRGCVWIHAVAAIPWVYWMIRLGLQAVPPAYEEAARLDAAPLQVFRHVSLPMMIPVLVASALYVWIVVSTEITVTDRYQYRSYAEVLYYEFMLNTEFDTLPLNAAPIGFVILSVLGGGLLLCRFLWPRLRYATQVKDRTLPTASWGEMLLIYAAVFVFVMVPVGNLFYQAGIDVEVDPNGSRIRTWTWSKLTEIIANTPGEYRYELAWSGVLTQLSVAASVLIAIAMARWARTQRWRQGVCIGTAIVCFVTPGPFIGLTLIALLNRDQPEIIGWLYNDTVFAPWIAITIRCLPFSYLLVWYGIRSIPDVIFEVAAMDGAGGWRRFRYVLLPQLMPYILCAAVVAAAISLGELSASVLVIPAGVTTVASETFNLIHYGADDRLAGLCLISTGAMTLITAVAYKLLSSFR